ncbi:fungal hydrophobin domain-containing protein [Pochonia chlamydosporia 170]|uniref:Fungal hydrophobin domain-containing protein n=1 Tax=Pochonia chlamydosporia 170 TaxID=1380566 RepID=A0A179F849_METCM|nr:fungal hydrophobin domain-containing protein [Pochonia chlamydosporia 170]OAQ61597.1 fungal hydrophobin domain-containing protein [Pochonia chlamydosporia 170]
MKVTTTLIALAAAAMAAPTPDGWSDGWDGDDGSGISDICNNNRPYMVCCDAPTGVLTNLLCNLAVLGDTCSSSTFCCSAPPQNGLVNIGLNCVRV